VDPATLASDLTGLMTISDEVVLAGISIQDSNAIAPSGEDAIHSLQVKVLHAWKGDLKVGQTIMFSVPSAMLSCATSEPDYEGPVFATRTGDERWGEGYPKGPFVLFLRHSQGPEKELTPDLRLAGGDGIQGMFYIDYFVYPGVTTPGKPSAANGKAQFSMAERFALIKPCNSVLDGGTVKCLEYLKTGKDWIRIQHESDPLLKKYEGMETGKFFEEVDSVSRSLGYTTLLLEDR